MFTQHPIGGLRSSKSFFEIPVAASARRTRYRWRALAGWAFADLAMTRRAKTHPTIRFVLAVAALLIAALAGSASADDFDWGPSLAINTGFGSYIINGYSFCSPVESQIDGTCWDYSAIASLEAKYMLTRNDTAYSIDLSEYQVPMMLGTGLVGGGASWPMNQACYGGGIVQASELPWWGGPLQPGWQNQAVVSTGYAWMGNSVASLQTLLKTYGPGVIGIDSETYFYYPSSSGGTDATGVAGVPTDHVVSLVGYHDATSADDAAIRAAGGYWIIKNSWGNGWCDDGYGFIPYNLIDSASFYTGPAYYTGAMATATWQGNGGTWAVGGTSWTSSGSAYSWVNQETAAVFSTSVTNGITISGPAIAHSLTFNSGATGYLFSGGSLTVTAGGITANESVTINSPVMIGAPQTWTTAAGKTLTINGNVSTIISTLSLAGPGATVINGTIGDGGAMAGIGGSLTVYGPGMVTLTASNTYSNLTTVNGGSLVLSGSGGAIALSSGILLSGGTLLLDNSAANNNNRIGSAVPLTLQGGELSLVGNAAGTAQTVNSLVLQGGGNVISVTAGSSVTSLSVQSFTRSRGGAALVCGSALGTASSGPVAQILFSTPPTLSNSGSGATIGILPYFYGDNSFTGSGTDLVTYGSNGLRLLAANEYSGTIAAGTNVKLTGYANVNSSTSILALVLSNSGTAPQLALGNSTTLTLTSGAVLSAGGSGNSISGGTLTFGPNAATSYEGIIHTAANLAIGSAIADNAGNAVTLTKSGPATLLLTGSNTYSGGTFISSGTLQLGAGGNSGSIAGNITDMGTLAFCRSDAFTLAGNISGSGGVCQSGCNLTILSGAVSYTGLTVVGAGTLAVTAGTASGGSTIAAGATLQLGSGASDGWVSGSASDNGSLAFDRVDNVTFSDNIGGSGRVLQLGAGGATLSGSNSYTGGTVISAGALSFAASSALPPSGAGGDISIAPGAALGATGPYSTVTAWINSGRIATSSSGAIALVANSSENINLATAGGGAYRSLSLGSCGTNVYSGTLTPAGNTYYLGGGYGTLVMATANALTDSSNGASQLQVNGNVAFSGSNSYSGGTTLNGGALSVEAAAALGSGPVTVNAGLLNVNQPQGLGACVLTINGGTIDNTSGCPVAITTNNQQNWDGDFSFQGSNDLNLGTGAVTLSTNRMVTVAAGNLTVGGVISGPGAGLTKAGAGRLVLTGANTFSGPLNLDGGVLNFAAGCNLGAGTAVNFGGGTLQYAPGNTYDITARTVTMGPAGGTIDTGGNNVTLAGGLVGPGGLTKAGPGMLVLAGANSYAGTTAVSAGTLAYGGSGNILPGTVNVGPSPGNGGTLLFQGGSVVSFTATGDGNFNVAYGAMVAVQPGAAVTLAGDLKLGALNWGSSGNLVQSGGTLTINDSSSGRPLTIGEYPNETSTYSMSGGVLNVPNGTTYVAWDGNAVLSISGGTANLRQIQIGCGDGWSNGAVALSGSGALYLGPGGIGGPAAVSLGGGTLGASAAWSSSVPMGLSNTATIDTNGNAITLSGLLSGFGGLIKANGGLLTLSGLNTYSGNTTISGGTLQAGNPLALQDSTVVLAGGTLRLSTSGATLGGLSGSGNLSLAGGTLGIGNDGGNSSYSGSLAGGCALAKLGAGTLTLFASNGYSGGTLINSGTLLADFSAAGAPAANILPAGTAVTLGPGTLAFNAKSGGVNSQSLGNLTLNGVGSIALTLNGAASLNVTAGDTWTRAASSTVNVTLGGGTLTSAPAMEDGIVVGSGSTAFATVNGSDWATASGGAIGAYGGYTNDNYNSGMNTNILAVNPAPAAIASNTLAFRTNQANMLTLPGAVTLAAGGILVGSQVGGNATVISGGTLTSTTNELVVHQFAAGGLTINSVLADNGANPTSLTKAGPGLLVLNGANSFTGGATVGGGTLQGNAASIPSAVVLQNNADVDFNQPSGGTLGNVVSGAGSLTKSGSGVLTVAGVQSYSGATIISGGTLRLAAPATPPALPSDVAGNLVVWLDATDAASLGNPGNGGAVTTWTNLATSGSVGDFTGSAVYNSISAALNGLPAVHFSGGQGLSNATNFGNNVTVMYVGAMDGTQNRRLLSATGNNWLLGYWGGYQDQAYYMGWLTGQNSPATPAAHLYEGTVDASGNAVTYSSGSVIGSASGMQGPNGLSLGNGGAYWGEWSNCSVGELLVYNTVLSTADRQAAETYLEDKWFGAGQSAQLPSATAVNLSAGGATLDLNGASQTIGSLTGAAGSVVALGGGFLTTGGDNTSTTFAGTISGTAPSTLVKTGAGTMTLSASSGYAGATVVSAGGLTVAANAALGSGPLLLEPSAGTATVSFISPVPVVSSLASSGAGCAMVVLGNALGSTPTTLTIGGNNSSCVFGGSIVDAGPAAWGSVVKTGTGTLTLSGSNTYSGVTTVSAGSLQLGDGVAHNGYVQGGITDNATLVFANPAPQTWYNVISGTGAVVVAGGGTLTIGGQNTYTGITTVNNSGVWNGDNADLVLSSSSGSAISGDLHIGTAGGSGCAVVHLTQPNQLAPTSTVYFDSTPGNWAYLKLLGNNQTIAGLSCSTGGGVVDDSETESGFGPATLTLAGSGFYSFSGYVRDNSGGSGVLSLVKSGPGTQILLGGNITYSGGTTISAGTLQIGNPTTAGSLAGNVVDNAALVFANVGGQTYSGVISGSGNLTVTGSSTILTLVGATANTFAGTTVVSQSAELILSKTGGAAIPGNLTIGDGTSGQPQVTLLGANQIASTATVSFVNSSGNYARLSLMGNNQTLAGITDNGGAVIENGALDDLAPGPATLTLNLSTTNNNVSGYLRDNEDNSTANKLNLVINGKGALLLSGPNIYYTGNTTLNGGQLVLYNATSYNSPTTVNSGAKLSWSGNADSNNLNGGATIALNDGGTLENLNPANWTVINGAVTCCGATTINQTSNATGAAGEGFYLDGGLQGAGTCTINAVAAGSGVNLRNNNTSFSGMLVVNGIASTTPFAGSGIGVGGCTTGLQNADIRLNGTMELLNQGIGWADAAPGVFVMGALSGSGAMVGNFTGGGVTTVTVGNTNASGAFSGVIADGIGNVVCLVKTGTGTQTFSGPNTYSGGTLLNCGVLQVGGNSALGANTGALTLAGGTLDLHGYSLGVGAISGSGTIDDLSAVGNLTVGNGNASGSFSGTLQNTAGQLALTKVGAGTLVLAGANTYSGGTLLAGGTLQVGSNSALGSSAAPLALSGGLLDLHGFSTNVGSLSGSGVIDNLAAQTDSNLTAGSGNASGAFSGTIQDSTGQVSLTKTGTGTLVLAGANTYSGGTLLNGGVLQVGGNSALGASTGALTLAGGTLDLHGYSPSTGPLGGSGIIDNLVAGGSCNLTVNEGGPASTFSGTIRNTSGTVSLTVGANGALTLVGSDVYGGTTAVDGGNLQLEFSQNGSPPANIVNYTADKSALTLSGGTLTLQGKLSTSNSQQFNGLTINPGNSAVVLSASSSNLLLSVGSISRAAGGLVDFTLPSGTQSTYNGVVTTSGTTNGILGAYATVGGANWATVNSNGLVVPYGGYAVLGTGVKISNAPGANDEVVSSSNTVNMAGITATINTLLVDAPTQQTVNIGAGDTLRLGAVGGILLPPGADALTIDAAGSPGTLTAGGAANTAGELVLINNSSNLLTVNSAIADNGTGAVCVTKGGSGTLALEGANAYTGGTTLGAGILQLGNALALGAATASLNVAGGTLDLHGCNVNLGACNGSGNGTIDNLSGTGAYSLAVGNGNASSTFAGTIQNTCGQISLTKVGAGTFCLAGNVSVGGGATVSGGTLSQTAGNFSSPQAAVVDGGTFDLSGGQFSTASDYVGNSGMGTFTQTGGANSSANFVAIGVNPGSSGAYNLSGGQLSIPGTLWLGYAGAGTFTQTGGTNTATGQLVVGYQSGSSGAYNLSGGQLSIPGTLWLGYAGAGTFRQTGGTDTIGSLNIGSSGTYNLSGGMVVITGGAAWSGSGAMSFSGGTLALANLGNYGFASSLSVGSAATLLLTATNSGVDTNILAYGNTAAAICGGGTIVKTGSGWTELDYNLIQGFSGRINIQAGILGNGMGRSTWGASTTGMSVNVAPGAELDLRSDGIAVGALTGSGNVVNTWNGTGNPGSDTLTVGLNNASSTFSGSIMGAGGGANNVSFDAGVTALVKTGSGALTLAGANTYGGTTTIGSGTLQLGTGAGGQDGSISQTGGVTDNAVLVYNLAGTQTAGYAVNGSGSLAKLGPGTLALSGSNGYQGGTTVAGGVLQLGNNSALGTGGLTVAGGTLDLEGYSPSIAGLSGAAGLITNSSASESTLTVVPSTATTYAGAIDDGPIAGVGLVLDGPGRLVLAGNDEYTGSTTIEAGTLEVTDAAALPAGTSLTVDAGGTFIYDPSMASAPITNSAAAVPEPSSFVLLAVGAAGLLGYRLRRRVARTAKPATFDQPDAPTILSSPSFVHGARGAKGSLIEHVERRQLGSGSLIDQLADCLVR